MQRAVIVNNGQWHGSQCFGYSGWQLYQYNGDNFLSIML